MAPRKQWHPVFAALLRPLVESQYEVHTNVPVGDAPRLADLLLLRRTHAEAPPLAGIWRHLRPWNVLEFKGPTVSPRDQDLDSLIEVGLGIQRRLNAERLQQRQPPLGAAAVAFWYLANRLGRRLRHAWAARGGPLQPLDRGVWRCEVLGRVVFLVSGTHLPVDEGSLPLHVIGVEPPELEQAVARFVAAQPRLWEEYSGWLAALHPQAYQGVQAMARTSRRTFDITLEPLVEAMGMPWVVEKLGLQRVIEEIGPERVLAALGPERVLANLNPQQICAALTPRQRQQLLEALQSQTPRRRPRT